MVFGGACVFYLVSGVSVVCAVSGVCAVSEFFVFLTLLGSSYICVVSVVSGVPGISDVLGYFEGLRFLWFRVFLWFL